MPVLTAILLAIFLTLVPVTLLVPGLSELVRDAHGGTSAHAHAFMALNMLGGILAVPLVMRLHRRGPPLRTWIAGLLLVDAGLFLAMRAADSVTTLLWLRALDGATHLPAVTLLMVAANRVVHRRRGATLGAVASAIMFGVAAGAPLGGWLAGRGADGVYTAGAILLVVAAVVIGTAGTLPEAEPVKGSRYRWNHADPRAWMPLVLGFMDRFTVGVFSSTFTLYLSDVLQFTATARGLLISLFMLPFALLCYPAGRLTDRSGWLVPMVAGNVGFGLVFAAYGVVPAALMPAVMVASGVLSALMYAPNLVVVGEMARRGAGEGLFGAFQVAGSLGFLAGPVFGGVLVEASRHLTGAVAWTAIFSLVGTMVVAAGVTSAVVLRPLARAWAGGAEADAPPA